jgi:hypothetical protein
MSEPILQLTTQGNWSQIYDENREAAPTSVPNIFYPIPAYEIPFLIERHILAIRCLSPSAKATWRYAGTLSQRFQLGTGGAASGLPTVEALSIGLRLNRTKLVVFKKYTQQYELLFETPFWMKSLRLSIWQYEGTESDSTEDLIRELLGFE